MPGKTSTAGSKCGRRGLCRGERPKKQLRGRRKVKKEKKKVTGKDLGNEMGSVDKNARFRVE